MWAIWAKLLLLQALKSCPTCNKLPNLITISMLFIIPVWILLLERDLNLSLGRLDATLGPVDRQEELDDKVVRFRVVATLRPDAPRRELEFLLLDAHVRTFNLFQIHPEENVSLCLGPVHERFERHVGAWTAATRLFQMSALQVIEGKTMTARFITHKNVFSQAGGAFELSPINRIRVSLLRSLWTFAYLVLSFILIHRDKHVRTRLPHRDLSVCALLYGRRCSFRGRLSYSSALHNLNVYVWKRNKFVGSEELFFGFAYFLS